MPTVRGALVFADPPPRVAATVRIRVEDVSRLDTAAPMVGAQILRLTRFPTASVPFAVAVEPLRPGHTYSVRAHVDVSGDGQISPGDFVTTRHHPVTADGPACLDVDVHRVR